MSTTVAIAYDFDGTLAPGNMQEHVFLPKLGIDPPRFWERSNRLAEEQQGDRTLTYMHRMLRRLGTQTCRCAGRTGWSMAAVSASSPASKIGSRASMPPARRVASS